MKKILFLIIMMAAVTGSVCAQPQITFRHWQQELGYVIWKKPATVTYEFTNTGDKPLVISNVTSSCGCTSVTWTEKAVAPKGKGTVTAVFDAELIGQFWKEIGVYCNASDQPVYLSFSGEVTATSKNYSYTHPYTFGGVALDKNAIDFGDVSKGAEPTFQLLVANATGKEYAPVLMHLPAYLSADAAPETLAKGKDGKITVTLHSDRIADMGEIRTKVYLSRYPGDKVGKDNEIPVTIVLLPDFNSVSSREKTYPPIVSVTETIDFGQMLPSQKKSQTVMLTNIGKTLLTIYSMSVSSNALGVKLTKRSIAPGESVKMKVTFNPKHLASSDEALGIQMITNDPKHPKVNVKVNASLK